MDYTVQGVLQARILEWVDFPFSRGILPTQKLNWGVLIAGGFFPYYFPYSEELLG